MSKNLIQMFPLGDILSLVTNRMVSLGNMESINKLRYFLARDNNLSALQSAILGDLFTIQILKQHPQLEGVNASRVNNENLKEWLNEQIAKFGEELPIEQSPEGLIIF